MQETKNVGLLKTGMASSFFTFMDDIAALMDDVAVASKLATKKTAGILGDDLAVNAEKATGFLSSRELPVLWSITKGSFLNKLIIIPIIFLLNFLLPVAIKIILVAGGFYLAYEGVEKIIEYLFHRKEIKHTSKIAQTDEDSVDMEKKKVKSAITTDFILSIEIVIIALASVLDKSFTIQIITVSVVALIATIGVYGIVALIVRMDDAGYRLIKYSKEDNLLRTLGNILVKALPIVIKALSVIGTIALILVAGGIFIHNIDYLHHILPNIPSIVNEFIIGLIAGLLAVSIVMGIKKVIGVIGVSKS